jgi:hypothetical protein
MVIQYQDIDSIGLLEFKATIARLHQATRPDGIAEEK